MPVRVRVRFVQCCRVLPFLVLPCFLAAQSPPGKPDPAEDPQPSLSSLGNIQIIESSTESVSKVEVSGITPVHGFASPSTISVVDRATLLKYNVQTVEEALGFIPGMSVGRTFFKRSIPTARGILQDHYATRVLVLINGVPTWNAVTGEGEIYRIDVADVERIEVLRGPGSVLYGSNAYAGTVNLVLRKTLESQGEIHAGAVSRQGYLGGIRWSKQRGRFQYSVSANRISQSGYPQVFLGEDGTARPFRDHESVSNATLTANYGPHGLLVNLFKGDEGYLGNVPSWTVGIGKNHDNLGRLFNYTYASSLGPDIYAKAGLSYDWSNREFAFNTDATRQGLVEGYRRSAFLRLNHRATRSFAWEVGGDFESRSSVRFSDTDVITGVLYSDLNMKGRSISEGSIFLQGQYDDPRFHILVGSRYTKNDVVGSNVSSRISAVVSLSSQDSLKLIAGQSFRAPTFFELYYIPITQTVFGNPNLKPEKATSLELVYLAARGRLFLQALVYSAAYEGKIARVRLKPTDLAVVYQNLATFRATGTELEFKFQDPDLVDAFVNLEHFLKTDAGDDNPPGSGYNNFNYVPKYRIRGGVHRAYGGFYLSATGTYEASTHGDITSIAAQGTADFTIGYKEERAGSKWNHALSIKNLGDRETFAPEYTRHILNEIPQSGLGRRVSYTLRVTF